MIVELKKNLLALGGDFKVTDDDGKFFCSIDFIKGGLIIQNVKGGMVAQILSQRLGVEISIADSPALFINNNFEINAVSLKPEELNEISIDKARSSNTEYFIFGKPSNYQYDLFIKAKGELKPVNVANIIPRPWKEDNFKVRINDDCNQLKVLTIVLAFAIIAMGGIK